MRALFLARIQANGTPDLPPMLAPVEDQLTYLDGWRGGYVVISERGLRRLAEINWTNNVAIVLVRGPNGVIERMKAATNSRWFALRGRDRTDADDDAPTAETPPEDDDTDPTTPAERVTQFRAWLKAAVNASSITATRKTAWRTWIDGVDIGGERRIRTLACGLCGVTWAQVMQGMIA